MEKVVQFLLRMDLSEYTDAFESNGYDDLPFLAQLDAPQLEQVAHDVGMVKIGHIKKLKMLTASTANSILASSSSV